MVHKIFGWIEGYVKVRIQGKNVERFVNLCRNHGIILWNICWDSDKEILYFYMKRKDFYQLRPFVRKCKVRPIIVARHGLPFLVGKMKKRASFFVGIAIFAIIMLVLSTRIWGIHISGQSYHTQESILKYLESINVYGGMKGSDLLCNGLEEKLRKHYKDIGWVSVEKRGCNMYIRIKEVLLVEKAKKEQKGHLIASESGKVVSIVTRKGTAKVKAGKEVKKGQVLISGQLKIYGDNQEIVERDYVQAEGNVIIASQKQYKDVLKKQYRQKVYTGRSRKVYECCLGKKSFFYYNPLKSLETYKKYDIIREGGQLCPFLSLRFPVKRYVKTFRELEYEKTVYSPKEAKKRLQDRLDDYIYRQKKKGYMAKEIQVEFVKKKAQYEMQGEIVFYKKQEKYRRIHKKNRIYQEREKSLS